MQATFFIKIKAFWNSKGTVEILDSSLEEEQAMSGDDENDQNEESQEDEEG